MFHLRLMVRQMLNTQNIPNIKEWEEVLLKLALRIARELTFTANPQRQGTDMDVRRYVKIKKIPGGSPKDSEYVDGAVITKNVAHKSMTRSQRNPRVMLITFPLEFSRVEGQYLHFGQIVRQEKEYLGNLASRIAALRPHVVLVEKSVSRLALEALAKHHIAVARAVKPSAIQFVARMTQGDVFSSMDKLALEPRLGHSSRFRIQTFDHPLIPGRRKTYMRFEGCNREMGCTIILRGGDIDTLRRVKKVTSFLTFIVRNLKLETHLWKDSVITLPALSLDAVPPLYNPRAAHTLPLSISIPLSASPPGLNVQTPSATDTAFIESEPSEDDLPDEDAEQLRLSRRIQASLEPYLTTFISVSATLRFPPPHPIRRMKELDDELVRTKRAWEDEVIRREETHPISHRQDITVTPTSFESDDLSAQIESLHCPGLATTPRPGEVVPAAAPAPAPAPTEESGYFDYKLGTSASQAVPEEPTLDLKIPEDIALESQLSYVKWQHEEQQRVWEWYLRKNHDDFVVEKYQCISLLEFTLPIGEFGLQAACFPPRLKYITYYGENDCTLGQFIENSVSDTMAWTLDPKKPLCTGKGCDHPLARHCKVYVHNETRLFIAVEQWDGQIIGRGSTPAPELITTWSACRVCGMATPFIPVSEEMQRYSFAKFLELHFYPADVQLVQGAGCQHNIYQHHIRYFAIRGMTMRFQTDPIILQEIVYPPMRIRVRPETQLELKNTDYRRLMTRNIEWYTALIADLKLINIDAATGDEETDNKLTADINALIIRAGAEQAEVAALLNKVYKESTATDTLALNHVRSYRQDKIVAWQADFDRLPKPKGLAIDKNGRRVSGAFGTVRAMWPRRYELSGVYDNAHMLSSSVSEAEEHRLPPPMLRRVTGGSMASSSASEASEPEPESSSTDVTRSNSTAKVTATQSESEALSPPVSGTSTITGDRGHEPKTTSPTGTDADSDSTIGASKADAAGPTAKDRLTTEQAEKCRILPSTFERISKDNERANRRYAVIRGRRARPVASARAKVEILDSVKDAIMDESESSDSSSEADDEGGDEEETRKSSEKPSPEASGTLPAVVVDAASEPSTEPQSAPPTSPALSKVEETPAESSGSARDEANSVPPSPFLSSVFSSKEPVSPPATDLDVGPQERHSLLKALSGFWPQQIPQPRSRMEFDGEDPMTDPEHIFRDSSMVVRTDEPTSIIALALNSPQYREMLSKSRAEKRQSREPKIADGGESFMPDDRSIAESNSTWGVVNVESTEGINPSEELRVPSSKLPWAITFESGGLTISCTVLYPEQFDALRRTYDCEKSIIESLARCVKWDASGGKSGSAFLKTRDDRFIAKEMSRAEVQTMETFAPAYFDYMSSAVSANRPTLLAKVFGCYNISFKKNGKDKGNGRSKSTQMNLLVMENLFYDRRFSKIYDLKGSTRNRHVQSTGRENEVLLDENLVQTAHLSPFYLREHSKRILRGALYNDSKFLADINVMDYSLVVGVDSVKNELVIGIVDYVRTYTWDKKLESWVKESTFLGGGGKGEPTIVTPKQYRQRFTSAMERYFPLVPDRWMKQHDAPEEDGNSLLELWPDW
ncbi:hypothetical protein EWM64_g586 [Hericium alpestre]|uniref:1-phosphatidylinositol-3-phosphate 5-kinase n=1 Tax=Hericium alpestre TaxID=135208 RepID=A0A4Z0AAS5_9AGAM|nr:hypothetical protein EWM64_g586 [Hericium alpestre]